MNHKIFFFLVVFFILTTLCTFSSLASAPDTILPQQKDTTLHTGRLIRTVSKPDSLNHHARPHYNRYRQFYLSMDVDLTRIPFPAVEYNTLGQFKFHPLYF
jgi:hypothetical protein